MFVSACAVAGGRRHRQRGFRDQRHNAARHERHGPGPHHRPAYLGVAPNTLALRLDLVLGKVLFELPPEI